MAALNWFVGRACTSKLPLSIGLISSVQNRIGRLSTKAGDDMLDLIESDYSAQQSSNVQDGFPFKIIKDDKKGWLCLERQLRDETITVSVLYDAYVRNIQQHIQFSVQIRHHKHKYIMRFNIHARPDEMLLRHITMCGNLEPFNKFWEMRGMTPATADFLVNYYKLKHEVESKRIDLKLLHPRRGVGDESSSGTPVVIKLENRVKVPTKPN